MLDAAYQELLAMRAANGGKPCYKDIQTVINKFRSRGYESVSRHGLDYRIRLDKQGKKMPSQGKNNVPICSTVTVLEENSEISSLTEQDEERQKNCGGRATGTMKKAKQDYLQLVKNCITKASKLYAEYKAEAFRNGIKVAKGTLTRLIKEIEETENVKAGSIKRETVLSRVQSGNVSGICHQKVSPLAEVEPLLVVWLIRLGQMGEALIKEETMDLMDDLICNTVHSDRLIAFCRARNVQKEGPEKD
jgi:hypothetical protein